jgi:hypothetical protein
VADMPTPTKQEHSVADINAVREFLLSGREIPPAPKPSKRGQQNVSNVPVHQGISRARDRASAKD